MEKKPEIEERKNYRITIIMKDEIIVEKFYREDIAKKTVTNIKELFLESFIGGALEERRRKWEVIWTLGNKKTPI